MLSSRLLFLSLSAALVISAASLNACGDDPAPASSGDGGASSSSSSSSSSSGSSSSSSGSTTSSSSGSSGSTNPDGGTFDIDGGGPCGTYAFGKPAAQFGPVDPGASTTPWDGGIPPGIYDVVKAERASANPGSWRETFVVGPNGRFSRARELDLNGGGPNAITYRSGTMSPDGGVLYFAFDCAIDGDAGVDSGTGSIPYQLVDVSGEATLRFEFFGVRVTTDRR